MDNWILCSKHAAHQGRGTKLGGQLDTLFKTCSTLGEGRGGEQSWVDNWILCSKHAAHQGRGGGQSWEDNWILCSKHVAHQGRGTKLGGQLDTLFKTCSTPGEGDKVRWTTGYFVQNM